MKLRQLLDRVGVLEASPAAVLDQEISGLAYHSGKVGPGYAFWAFPGAKQDGRRFVDEALAHGASAVVYQQAEGLSPVGPHVIVAQGRYALAAAAKEFYGRPDEKVAVTGFTGTNGKSTGTLVADGILQHAGRRTSLINTIGYHVCGTPQPAVNTTPESLDLYAMLAKTRDLGGTHLTMEVSSHALALGRVEWLQVAVAVYTNLTRDHLDFHGDMESYFAAKARLFGGDFRPGAAVLNADDEWTPRIETTPDTRRLTYGIRAACDLRAVRIESSFAGLRFEIAGKAFLTSKLVGEINVYNILAAAGACHALGLSWDEITAGVAAFEGVPGRFQRVEAGQPFLVVVDYAHTDDALRNVIRVARQLLAQSGQTGRVLTLFGCGGDRDRAKRPLMGMAAAELSDLVFVTSDNPRSEDPLAIINDALVGVRRFDTPVVTESNRAHAIELAMAAARPGDIVLLAGKGHETYQVLRDRTINFDDRTEALRALAALGYGGLAAGA